MAAGSPCDAGLAGCRARVAGVAGLLVDRCVKTAAGADVCTGTLDGAPVLIKAFHGADAAQTVDRMAAELALVAQAMGQGPFRVNRCLLALPERGVAALEFVPGMRLSDAVASAGPGRGALIAQAGRWLAAYVGDRRRVEDFAPWRWIALRKEAARGGLTAMDAALYQHGLRALRGMARALIGQPMTRAATHGDFVGINALFHQGVICGLDIQGESWLPLARDAARFLVWQQITDPGAGDGEAFLSSGVLPPHDAGPVLAFFVGEQLLQRLAEDHPDPAHRARAAEALAGWLAAR